MSKRTIAVDFDGTIAKYDGWSGIGEFGEPIENAKWALDLMKEKLDYTIIIHTCRLEIPAVREYLVKHNIPFDYINHNPENIEFDLNPLKIKADVYIDDRAIRFTGSWSETIGELTRFGSMPRDTPSVSSKDIK